MSAGIRFSAAVMGLFILLVSMVKAEDPRAIRGAIQRGVAALKAQQTKVGYWKQTEPEADGPAAEE